MSDLTFTAGDTAPSIFGALTIDTAAANLTGASGIRFRMRQAIDRRFKVDGAGEIVSATEGSVRYDLAATDMDTPGEYVARWWIEWADGTGQYSDQENTITIEPA